MTKLIKTGVVKYYNAAAGFGYVHVENQEVRLSAVAAGAFVDQLVAKAFVTMDVAPGPGNLDVIVAITAVEPPPVRPQAVPAKPVPPVKVVAPREEGVLATVKSFDPKKGGVVYLSGNPDRSEATLSKALFDTPPELPKGTPLLVSIIQNSEGWFVTQCEFGPSVELAFNEYMKSQLQLIAEQQAAAANAATAAAVVDPINEAQLFEAVETPAPKPKARKVPRAAKPKAEVVASEPVQAEVVVPTDSASLVPIESGKIAEIVLKSAGSSEVGSFGRLLLETAGAAVH